MLSNWSVSNVHCTAVRGGELVVGVLNQYVHILVSNMQQGLRVCSIAMYVLYMYSECFMFIM